MATSFTPESRTFPRCLPPLIIYRGYCFSTGYSYSAWQIPGGYFNKLRVDIHTYLRLFLYYSPKASILYLSSDLARAFIHVRIHRLRHPNNFLLISPTFHFSFLHFILAPSIQLQSGTNRKLLPRSFHRINLILPPFFLLQLLLVRFSFAFASRRSTFLLSSAPTDFIPALAKCIRPSTNSRVLRPFCTSPYDHALSLLRDVSHLLFFIFCLLPRRPKEHFEHCQQKKKM